MEKISILSDGSILYLSDNNEILITLDELKGATGRVDLYELYLNLRLSFSKEKSIEASTLLNNKEYLFYETIIFNPRKNNMSFEIEYKNASAGINSVGTTENIPGNKYTNLSLSILSMTGLVYNGDILYKGLRGMEIKDIISSIKLYYLNITSVKSLNNNIL